MTAAVATWLVNSYYIFSVCNSPSLDNPDCLCISILQLANAVVCSSRVEDGGEAENQNFFNQSVSRGHDYSREGRGETDAKWANVLNKLHVSTYHQWLTMTKTRRRVASQHYFNTPLSKCHGENYFGYQQHSRQITAFASKLQQNTSTSVLQLWPTVR